MKKSNKIIAIVVAAVAVAVCVSLVLTLAFSCNNDNGRNNGGNKVDLTQTESPMLKALVKDGKLPELSDRLPKDPKVLTVKEYGAYGGTWRQSVTNATKGHAFSMVGFYQGKNLVVWNEDHSEIVPNIAKEVTLSEDAKELTVTLRKGLKWSDGNDMNTEDVEFWWNAYATNQEVAPGSSTWDETTLTIVDTETFKMTFENPKPLILGRMADGSTGSYWFLPKHYLSQFHNDYSETAKDKARELMFDSWVNCFLDRMEYMINPDMPVMSPWKLNTSGTAATQLELVRNPYYWATDDKGRQLPYIDTCLINIVQDDEVVVTKTVSGEFEMAYACVMETMANYPLYAQNKANGNYEIYTAEFDEPNAMNIHLNLTHNDSKRRAYFQNKDFRIALSLAINRQEIIDVQYTVGKYKSVARQFSPTENSPYYDEELSTQYTRYDIEEANRLLDSIGLNKKNAKGIRMLDDKRTFDIVIQVPGYSNQWNDVANMIAGYWQAVGINASTKYVDTSLWEINCVGNNFDCTVFTGGGGFEILSDLSVNDYTGYDFLAWPQRYAAGAYTWRSSNGTGGVEPMQCIKDLWEIGNNLVKETDKQRQEEYVRQILRIHKDNFLIMGVCSRLPAIYLVSNKMRNVPVLSPSWNYGYTGHGNPEQYWIA